MRKYFLSVISIVFFATNINAAFSVMYLLAKDISLMQINLLDIFILVLVMLLEIPTGVIGDKYSHKFSAISSLVCRALYLLLLTLTNSFILILLVSVFYALSDCFWSGSFITWYMELLFPDEERSVIISERATINMTASIIAIISGAAGAFFSDISLDVIYYISSSLLFISAILLSFIPKEKTQEEPSSSSVAKITKDSFLTIKRNKVLLTMTVLAFVFYFVISGIDNFWQPYIYEISAGDSVAILGFAWVFIRTGTFLAGLLLKKISKDTDPTKILFVAFLVSSLSLFGMIAFKSTWIFAALLFALHAMATVVANTTISGISYKEIPVENKATVLSFISIINSLSGILGLLLFGYLATIKLIYVFALASLIVFCLFIYHGVKGKRNKTAKA